MGVLLREMVELEQQGAGRFFGEPEFDLDDLLVVEPDGRGRISVLELQDVQDRPALFSTFMLWMLAELYQELPEVGDLDKPKLVFFLDEAHLLFDNASKALRDQIEQVVRLIRSKGVGVFFVTQSPKDIPAEVLGQLGHKVQHALRAFTPDDEKALRAAARTFPRTPFYEVEEMLTSLGTGEALVTTLSASGVPTPPFATRMVPPASRMGPLSAEELRRATPRPRWCGSTRRRWTGRARKRCWRSGTPRAEKAEEKASGRGPKPAPRSERAQGEGRAGDDPPLPGGEDRGGSHHPRADGRAVRRQPLAPAAVTMRPPGGDRPAAGGLRRPLRRPG